MTPDRLTVLMSGMVAGTPYHGGATWAALQYVLGLRRLGHDVYLVEPIEPSALQPTGSPLIRSENASYFLDVMQQFDLLDRSALLDTGSRQTVGLSYEELRQAARSADVLINVSGMLADENLLEPIPTRVYLDLDPAFNQLWHAQEGIDMHFAGHTHFVTVGQAIGHPDCPVPTCGIDWIPTLQPVVLEHWQPADRITVDAFTTIGNWRGYGSVQCNGTFYGQKAHSLRQFITLPSHTDESFALALAIDEGETNDWAALRTNGWQILDPFRVAATPAGYHSFVQGSKGELGIAKSGYVLSRCAWFSDRSVCYLASGRPVIAQDTGFSRYLPTGHGLFAFDGEEDVLAAIDDVNSSYQMHASAAREVAEAYFDSDTVLSRLLDRVALPA